jgi:hypothetical protein
MLREKDSERVRGRGERVCVLWEERVNRERKRDRERERENMIISLSN